MQYSTRLANFSNRDTKYLKIAYAIFHFAKLLADMLADLKIAYAIFHSISISIKCTEILKIAYAIFHT